MNDWAQPFENLQSHLVSIVEQHIKKLKEVSENPYLQTAVIV